jgi:ATP-dependent Lon protease
MPDKKVSSSHSPAEAGIYPVLPLRDIVVFPHMIVPLFVGREKSIRALEEVMGSDKQIMLATQINAGDDDPDPSGIYQIGAIATVLQLLKLPDGTVKVLVEGTHARAKSSATPTAKTISKPTLSNSPRR